MESLQFLPLKRVVSIIMICILINAVSSQSQSGNQTIVPEDEVPTKRPIDEGMEPLYEMMHIFLNLVQPQSKGHILQQLNFTEFSKSSGTIDQLWVRFKYIPEHYIGFAACIAVGILFIIIFPIVGLCCCCCRCCCGNCGGKTDPREGKNDRCKRIVCGLLLFLFNTIILIGMVCAFVTNELIRERTSNDLTLGVLPRLADNIQSIANYKDSVFTEIESTVAGGMQTTIDDIAFQLAKSPVEAKQAVGEFTNSENVLGATKDLAESALRINTSLTEVDSYTTILQNLQGTLNNQLDPVKNELKASFNGISSCTGECQTLKTIVNNDIDLDTDFNNLVSVKDQLKNVHEVVDSNLTGLVTNSEQEFNSIVDEVQKETTDEIDAVVDEAKTIVDEIKSAVKKAKDQLDDVIQLDNIKSEIQYLYDDKNPLSNIDTIGNYRWIAGLALSCIILLIVLLYYLGLLFGVFGNPPDEYASTCNRGVGANMLMASVGFTFLFAWLFMLVILITFLVGGVTHTEACRHMVNIEDNENNIVDQLISDNLLQDDFDFKISAVLSVCKGNGALLEAIDINKLVNISETLNLEQYNIKQKIDDLANATVDLSDVDIYTAELATQMQNLADADLDSIDFDTFNNVLTQPLTKADLSSLATRIRTYAESSNPPANVANALKQQANDLAAISNGVVMNDTKNTVENLKRSVANLEQDVKGKDGTFSDYTVNLRLELEKAEKGIQTNGTVIISDYIKSLGNIVYDETESYAEDTIYALEHEVGRCRPLYGAFDRIIDSVCVDFLDPFNGFWFCLGWFIFFSIPTLIVALFLVSLYRKSEEYDGYLDNKSFDDPMQQQQQQQRQQAKQLPRHGGNGQQNPSYRDDYPPARAADYYPTNASNGGYGGNSYAQVHAQGPPHYYNNRY